MSLSNLALLVVGTAALAPAGAAQPLEGDGTHDAPGDRSAAGGSGAQPFERTGGPGQSADTSGLPTTGTSPLAPGHRPVTRGPGRRDEARPLGAGPASEPAQDPEPLDPSKTRMLRLDLLVGTTWRSRTTDIVLSTSAQFGQMRGFSGSFHTAMIVATTPPTFFAEPDVRALDFPIGLGGLYRGRLRKRAMYGSVGLTAGILVHRAVINDGGLQHRVDPDIRVPLRLAWTIADVGVSLGLDAGYSVRRRSYERRGGTVWARNAFRVGLIFGLHWDKVVPRRGTGGT